MLPGNFHFYTELPIGVCIGPWAIGMLLAAFFFEALLRGDVGRPIIIVPIFIFGWVFDKIWMFFKRFFIFLKLLWKEIASIDYSPVFEFIINGLLVIIIMSIIALTVFIIIRGIHNNT